MDDLIPVEAVVIHPTDCVTQHLGFAISNLAEMVQILLDLMLVLVRGYPSI